MENHLNFYVCYIDTNSTECGKIVKKEYQGKKFILISNLMCTFSILSFFFYKINNFLLIYSFIGG